MIDDFTRRKLFWLLKKYSSYTYWKRIAEAFDAFAEIFEHAVACSKNPGDTSDLKEIYDTKVCFEKGLARLEIGDRSVFCTNSSGYLKYAKVGVGTASRWMNYGDLEEINPEYNLDWMGNYLAPASNLIDAVGRLSGYVNGIVQSAYIDDPAFLSLERLKQREIHAGQPYLPDPLPPVPEPQSVMLVKTGEELPAFGIWEPIEFTPDTLLKGTSVSKPVGCMNYLLQGLPAPTAYLEDIVTSDKPHPVTWQLVWEDTRYSDGKIPGHEAEYLIDTPRTNIRPVRLRALPGEPCPKTGEWMVGHTPSTARRFKRGEIMRELNLPNGATIWMFIGD